MHQTDCSTIFSVNSLGQALPLGEGEREREREREKEGGRERHDLFGD